MDNAYTLTLMRHAKSSWSDQGLSDHDRPLNARGHRDAPIMSSRLLTNGPTPDLIFCSTAARARATAEYVLAACADSNCQPQYEESASLYLASPQTLLQSLEQLVTTARHVVLIAHNPGLEDLSYQLSDGACDAPMPTACIRQFSCPDWKTLAQNHANLSARTSESSEAIDSLASLVHDDYPKKSQALL